MFKKVRIEYLLFSCIAGLTTTLLVIVIWVAYSYSAQHIVQNTSYYQQSLLNEYYNKIVLQTRAVEQISLTTSRNPNLLKYMDDDDSIYKTYTKQQEVKALLSQITYANKNVENVYFYVEKWSDLNSTFPVRFIHSHLMKEEPWYSEELENTDFHWVGEHSITSHRGKVNVISFARKVYSESEEYQGLLLLNIDSDSIKQLFKGNDQANRLLLDSGGRQLLSIGELELEPNQINQQLSSISNGSGYKRVQIPLMTGEVEEFLMVWSKNINENWTLVEFTPLDELTKGSVKIAIVLGLVGIGVIIVAFICTLVFARQFVKPIRLLLKEMGGYFGSNNKINLPTDYSNEFGRMFSGYRKLMERIDSLYASLEEQYNSQKEAEIKALQAMINPHFLYNTLDQLNWMAIGAGQEKISQVLELMGKMFRIGLSNGENLIAISDELTLSSCYMEIQHIRLGEQFTLQLDIPEEILSCYIPKMTLQPFIENAFVHGFHGKESGTIIVKASSDEIVNQIEFLIIDDGNGLRENWEVQQKKKTGGYGIRNVKERIQIYFGDDYGIHLMNNSDGNGTTVKITIPILQNHDER